jgi:hypothetical protein
MGDWQQRCAKVKAGDCVAYSKRFLRSIHQFTGDMPQARGKVVSVKELGGLAIAEITWDRPDVPGKVNVANLSVVRDGVVMDRD